MNQQIQIRNNVVFVVFKDHRTELANFTFLLHKSSEVLVKGPIGKRTLALEIVEEDLFKFFV